MDTKLHAPRRRAGSVYVLILIVSAIISAIGLSALAVARLAHRGEAGQYDSIQAQTMAVSGLEHAHHGLRMAIESNPGGNWRAAVDPGADPYGPYDMDDGSFTWTIDDPSDGDLYDDPLDPVSIDVDATYRAARHRLTATLVPGPGTEGVNALQSAIHAGGAIVYEGNFLLSDGLVSANGDIVVNSNIYADVRAGGSYNGSTYHETKVNNAPLAEMPESGALDYYLAHGTYIDFALMDHAGAGNPHSDLQDLVFSPTLNPFGPPNPEGIYIVDCQGGHLKIKNSRIIGTIVVINPSVTEPTKIEKSLTWEPAFPNYPALLVEGDLIFKLENPPLSEAARSTNFNPDGAPFQGTTNGTQLDELPNVIKGLFYATGSIRFEEDQTDGPHYIEGVIIAGGDVTTTGNVEVHVRYDDTWALDPPPGFARRDGPHQIAPGSIVRVVD